MLDVWLPDSISLVLVSCILLYMLSMLSVRSGRNLTDDEIAGMLIGLLMAGQHTSSTTSSWLGFFLAKHQDIQVSGVKLCSR